MAIKRVISPTYIDGVYWGYNPLSKISTNSLGHPADSGLSWFLGTPSRDDGRGKTRLLQHLVKPGTFCFGAAWDGADGEAHISSLLNGRK